jgi:hypothetical protein
MVADRSSHSSPSPLQLTVDRFERDAHARFVISPR